jgi:hypothetical protein
LLGQIHAPEFGELKQFALDHVLGELDQHIKDLEVSFRERHLKRLHVQPVACQDAAMISPAGVCRGAAAACVSAVNHVVMNERGAVDQLDDGAQTDRASSAVSRISSRKQQQRRAQALASAAEQVARDFRDGLNGRAVLERKLLLDLDQVIAN